MMSREEDNPPLAPVPTMLPEPLEPIEQLPDTERPGSKTDPTPAEAQPDRTDEILTAVDALRRDSLAAVETLRRETLERDQSLANALLKLDQSLRDEFNTKLAGVVLRAEENLNAAVKLVLGAVDGTREEVVERFNELGYKLDRLTDERLTAIEGHVAGIAKAGKDQKAVFDERWKVIEYLAKHAYNLSAADAAADNSHADDDADRPTVTENPRR